MLVQVLPTFDSEKEENAVASADEVEKLIPDDPVPVGESELLPALNIHAQLVEATAKHVPETAPIVIEQTPEAEEAERAVLVQISELLNADFASGHPTVAEEVVHRPMIMPYAEDDERPFMPMPYASDSDTDDINRRLDGKTEKSDNSKFDSWIISGFRGMPTNATPANLSDLSKCQEDPHHHQQYSGCPYTGCPATDYRSMDRFPVAIPRQVETAPKTGGEEESEIMHRHITPRLQKKLRNLIPGDIDCEKRDVPKHPEVDTMEFRRTDRSLRELAPGGPY